MNEPFKTPSDTSETVSPAEVRAFRLQIEALAQITGPTGDEVIAMMRKNLANPASEGGYGGAR